MIIIVNEVCYNVIYIYVKVQYKSRVAEGTE